MLFSSILFRFRVCSGRYSTLPKLALAAGSSFVFPVLYLSTTTVDVDTTWISIVCQKVFSLKIVILCTQLTVFLGHNYMWMLCLGGWELWDTTEKSFTFLSFMLLSTLLEAFTLVPQSPDASSAKLTGVAKKAHFIGVCSIHWLSQYTWILCIPFLIRKTAQEKWVLYKTLSTALLILTLWKSLWYHFP